MTDKTTDAEAAAAKEAADAAAATAAAETAAAEAAKQAAAKKEAAPETVSKADFDAEVAKRTAAEDEAKALAGTLLAEVPDHLKPLVPKGTVAEQVAWIAEAKKAGIFSKAPVPPTDGGEKPGAAQKNSGDVDIKSLPIGGPRIAAALAAAAKP